MAPRDLTDTQKEMLIMAGRLSNNIVSEHPEWAELYVPGVTIKAVAESVNLYRDNSENVAYLALRGALKHLLGAKAFQSVAKKNHELAQDRALEEGTGIFSAENQAQLSENGKKGGPTAGRILRDEGRGIHGLGLEKVLANASTGGNKSAIARGHTPYISKEESPTGLGELEDALRLSRNHRHHYPEGHRNAHSPNYTRINNYINETYHGGEEIRQPKVLRSAVYRFLKTNLGAMKKLLREMVTAFDEDDPDRVRTMNQEFNRRYEAVMNKPRSALDLLYDNCRQTLVGRFVSSDPEFKDTALASARDYLNQIELSEAK